MAIVDLFMLYQFLRRLVQPIDKWDAYETGVIDADGKIIIKPSNRSIAQKDSFGKFDLLVLRLKLLLGKIPGGKSRIASFAAAMMLIKEQDNLHNIPDNMLQESLDIYINMMEDGGVPANVVGTGKIAGTDKPPVSRAYQKRIRRKRKDQANTLFIESTSAPMMRDTQRVANLMSENRKKKYLDAMAAFEQAIKSKEIYNAAFKEHYSYGFSRGLAEAYDNLVYKVYEIKMRENKFADTPSSSFGIASIKKLHKHYTPLKSKYPEIFMFFERIKGYPEMIKQVKSYIKKGKPPSQKAIAKAAERASYDPKTTDKLEQLFRVIGNELKGDYKTYVTDVMTKAIEDAKKHIEGKRWLEVFGERGKYGSRHPFYMILRQVYKTTGASGAGLRDPLSLDPQYKAAVTKEANHATEMFYAAFVNKNAMKLAGILKNREIAKLSHNLKGSSLTGTLKLELVGNGSFVMTFNVITKISPRGKWFNQFPTRFTSVKMEDGTMMRVPSEAKMKKEF